MSVQTFALFDSTDKDHTTLVNRKMAKIERPTEPQNRVFFATINIALLQYYTAIYSKSYHSFSILQVFAENRTFSGDNSLHLVAKPVQTRTKQRLTK